MATTVKTYTTDKIDSLIETSEEDLKSYGNLQWKSSLTANFTTGTKIASFYSSSATTTPVDIYVPATVMTPATSTTLGYVKLGSDTDQTVAANSVTATSGRTYAVQFNSSNQLVVNVPWTDTATSVAYTASVTSGTKLGSLSVNGVSTDIYAPTSAISAIAVDSEAGTITLTY